MSALAVRDVLIRGDGIAALCCARLLKKAGFRVAVERPLRARIPAIMLGDRAVALMRDVFDQPSLLAGAHRIEWRDVAWGSGGKPGRIPHSAVVVAESELLDSLAPAFEPSLDRGVVSPQWVIYASKPLPPTSCEHRFGTRRAVAAEVALKNRSNASGCRIESLNDGWLFLIPNASEAAWMLAVGAPLETLLAQSSVIGPRIELRDRRSAEFAASPAIATPLHGDGWLACGAAALGFDPICGDGAAQAVREAVLASAVIRAIAEGGDTASLFAHYETRLTAGMARHLALCTNFYRTGGSGPWWQGGLEALDAGQRWCGARLAEAAEPQWRLTNDTLTVYNRGK